MAPRIPSGKEEAKVKAMSPAEVKMAEAIALVQGQDPMRGIMMLREVLEEDPNNAEAHWHLGLFSIQSGQYEKALDRFRKVRELDEAGFPDVWFYLGRTYATLDSTDQAIACLKKYRTLTQDTVILNGVDRFLHELEGNEQH
ncbi:MAG: tetratricopeptide repeat protein [Flavobacteriales bacterium]|nr:tetratricopeptide repeat protein [Flavobacteriales bacterium]